jgi:hypothetical protein
MIEGIINMFNSEDPTDVLMAIDMFNGLSLHEKTSIKNELIKPGNKWFVWNGTPWDIISLARISHREELNFLLK